MYEGLVKSLRWLGFMFPETHPAQDDADRMSNNIHLYCTQAADAIEELSKRVPSVPHGRLIDADALTFSRIRIAHEDGVIGGYNAVVMSCAIKDAPTIIPAEEDVW